MNIKYYITIGGQGSRMKNISPKDKHLLYFKNKRIIEWIFDIVPTAKILGEKKTLSRMETLQQIGEEKNVIIIDCDIIPFGLKIDKFEEDTVYVFSSDKNKYGAVITENFRIKKYSEKENISNVKCSGVYCVKDMRMLLKNMKEKDSIISGMINAKAIFENTFKRFGDLEDYYESILQ